MKTYPTQVEFSPSLAGGAQPFHVELRQKYTKIFQVAVPALVVPTTFHLYQYPDEVAALGSRPGQLICYAKMGSYMSRPGLAERFLNTLKHVWGTIYPQIFVVNTLQHIFEDNIDDYPDFSFRNEDLFLFLTTGQDCVNEDPLFSLNIGIDTRDNFARYSKYASVGRTSYFYDRVFQIFDRGQFVMLD